MNLNKVFLIGRMANDPEVRTTPTGQQVTTIRIATNRVWVGGNGEKQNTTEFHSVVAWGRLADIIGQYMKKGSLIMIEGRLQTRSWVGQDGNKRYVTEIVAEGMQMGPRSSNENSGSYQPSNRNNVQQPVQIAQPVKEEEIPVINEDDPIISDDEVEKKEINIDDIPF